MNRQVQPLKGYLKFENTEAHCMQYYRNWSNKVSAQIETRLVNDPDSYIRKTKLQLINPLKVSEIKGKKKKQNKKNKVNDLEELRFEICAQKRVKWLIPTNGTVFQGLAFFYAFSIFSFNVLGFVHIFLLVLARGDRGREWWWNGMCTTQDDEDDLSLWIIKGPSKRGLLEMGL